MRFLLRLESQIFQIFEPAYPRLVYISTLIQIRVIWHDIPYEYGIHKVFIIQNLQLITVRYQTDRLIRKPEPSDKIFQRIQSKVDPLLKVLVKMTISFTIISGMVNEL